MSDSAAPPTNEYVNWTVQQVYDLYNSTDGGERLGDFIDAAEAVLERHISQFDRIQLSVCLGTAVAAPAETADFYYQAMSQWTIARLDRTKDGIEAVLRDTRIVADRLRDVAHEEEKNGWYFDDVDDDENEDEDAMRVDAGESEEPMPAQSDGGEGSTIGPDGATLIVQSGREKESLGSPRM